MWNAQCSQAQCVFELPRSQCFNTYNRVGYPSSWLVKGIKVLLLERWSVPWSCPRFPRHKLQYVHILTATAKFSCSWEIFTFSMIAIIPITFEGIEPSSSSKIINLIPHTKMTIFVTSKAQMHNELLKLEPASTILIYSWCSTMNSFPCNYHDILFQTISQTHKKFFRNAYYAALQSRDDYHSAGESQRSWPVGTLSKLLHTIFCN